MVSKEVENITMNKSIKQFLNETAKYFQDQVQVLDSTPQQDRISTNKAGEPFDIVSWKIGKLKQRISAIRNITYMDIDITMDKFIGDLLSVQGELKGDKLSRPQYLKLVSKYEHMDLDWKPQTKIKMTEIRKAIAACREGNPFE